MNKQAEKILKTIKDKQIRPKSKWFFLLKNYLIWTLFTISVFIGAIAISVIFFSLADNDWDIYRNLNKNISTYILISLPYIWIVILTSFSFLAYFNYKHTKRGYRINPLMIVSGSIFISIFLGIAFYFAGLGQIIEYKLSNNIPYYEKIIAHRFIMWNNPERGLLAGKIIKIDSANNFYIKALDNKVWKIIGNNILWQGKAEKGSGERIKIIGKMMGSDVFVAREVRPWIGKCMGSDGKCTHSKLKTMRNGM